jgi:hypothetical protein
MTFRCLFLWPITGAEVYAGFLASGLITVREFPLHHKKMPTLYGHSSRILCVFCLQPY